MMVKTTYPIIHQGPRNITNRIEIKTWIIPLNIVWPTTAHKRS
jgi:hypothetical protein